MKRLVLILAILTQYACGDEIKKENPAATASPASSLAEKGSRLVSIDLSMDPSAYDTNFTEIQTAGADFIQMSLNWDEIETSPGVYNDSIIDIAQAYYPAKGMKIALNLNTIDTVNDRRPADIKNLSWNDAIVIQRFKNLTDHIMLKMNKVTFVSISIGNEIDVYLENDSLKWAEYTEFFRQTSIYLKTKIPSPVYIGVKTTFDGTVAAKPVLIKAITQYADAALITYYPMNSDFTVKDPSTVKNDFALIMTQYSGKPVLFLEAGYQSGTLCKSSEEKQKQFIENLFSEWDTYKDSIKAVCFVWSHDKTPAEVDTMTAYYGITNPAFKEYLATLGLRKSDGTHKAAYTALLLMLKERGW